MPGGAYIGCSCTVADPRSVVREVYNLNIVSIFDDVFGQICGTNSYFKELCMRHFVAELV